MSSSSAAAASGSPRFGWTAALAAGAALATGALSELGLSVSLAAALCAAAFGLVAWLSLRRAADALALERERLSQELQAGRASAQQGEELLRSVLESTPLALVFYSDTGQIRYANSEARRLFFDGVSPAGQNFL